MSTEGETRGCSPLIQTLWGVNPPGLLKQAGMGGVAPSPTQQLLSRHQDRPKHLQSLENHTPFPERKAKCKSPSQTRICSSAARKVVKALISELGGRDKYISSTLGAEGENINSGITPAATEISPSLAVIQVSLPALQLLPLTVFGGNLDTSVVMRVVIAPVFPTSARLGGGRDSPGCISHSEQAGHSARLSPEIPFIRGSKFHLSIQRKFAF